LPIDFILIVTMGNRGANSWQFNCKINANIFGDVIKSFYLYTRIKT
jgi:hypothetical protein